jgi:hypothetical protein
MWGISWPAENLLASQEGLRSLELLGQEQIHNYVAVSSARNDAGVGPSKLGSKGCPETWVTKYLSTLRSILEQRSLTPWQQPAIMHCLTQINQFIGGTHCLQLQEKITTRISFSSRLLVKNNFTPCTKMVSLMLVNTAYCFDGAAEIKNPWQWNSTDIRIVNVTHSHLGKKFPDFKIPRTASQEPIIRQILKPIIWHILSLLPVTLSDKLQNSSLTFSRLMTYIYIYIYVVPHR